MEKILAFIDESGDPRFNVGASSHLEFSAVLINSEKEDEVIDLLQNVQKELDISEFKSQRIQNEKRRIKILNAIKGIEFKFINLSIDKSKIYGEWKKFPRVFYKYTQQILHRELNRLYPKKTVTIDKFGNLNYQKSLKTYLEKNAQLELFEYIVNIVSAKNDILIQLSDLIAFTHRKLRNN